MNGKSRLVADLISLVFLLLLCCSCAVGYTQTVSATNQSITIPIQQWQTLKSELTALNQDLIVCKTELQKAKKPSQELLMQLAEAENKLKLLQNQLAEQKTELTKLFSEVDESKTSLKKLKESIDKERRVHKRQVWQNRIWCILIGAGIGAVASK